MAIQFEWEWGADPALVVDRSDDTLVVRAHPGLSEAQVRAACSQLDGDGDRVYEAWAAAAGVNRGQ